MVSEIDVAVESILGDNHLSSFVQSVLQSSSSSSDFLARDASASTQQALPQRRQQQSEKQSDSVTSSAAIDRTLMRLIDEAIFGVVIDVHGSAKSGALIAEEVDEAEQGRCKIVESLNCDVFGELTGSRNAKTWECVCPNCTRSVAACKFAPHLEKCMGMGRTSSRVASRRAAASTFNSSKPTTSGNDKTAHNSHHHHDHQPSFVTGANDDLYSAFDDTDDEDYQDDEPDYENDKDEEDDDDWGKPAKRSRARRKRKRPAVTQSTAALQAPAAISSMRGHVAPAVAGGSVAGRCVVAAKNGELAKSLRSSTSNPAFTTNIFDAFERKL